MSDFVNVLRGGSAAPISVQPNGGVSTLEDLDAALNQSQALEPFEPFDHAGSGLRLHVVKMNLQGYDATDPKNYAVQAPATAQALVQGFSVSEATLIAKTKAFLMHSVRLSSDARIDDKRAYQIAAHDGWGGENLRLVAACEKFNPRPGDPIDLATLVFASQQWVVLMLDYLLETGALRDALKRIGMTESESEAMLRYQREVSSVLQLRQFAQKMGLPLVEVLRQRTATIQSAELGVEQT